MTIILLAIIVSLAVNGAWTFSDGLYSVLLYWNTPGHDGKRLQTVRRDHFIRFIGMGQGLFYIAVAVVLGLGVINAG